MTSIVKRFTIDSEHDTQLINITDRVRQLVAETGVQNGVANVMTMHTTTAITGGRSSTGCPRIAAAQ